MDISKFRTSQDKAVGGVWVKLGDTASIKVARLGNKVYAQAMANGLKPHRRQIQAKTLPDSVYDEVMVNALVEGVLLDWKGITEDGKELAYSKDTARRLLSDASYADFREFVVEIANEMSLFQEQETKEAEANLKR